jgi:Fe-S oxidoreductase
MSLLKTELLHAQIEENGLSLRQQLFSSLDFLGRVGCFMPRLSNAVLNFLLMRGVLAKILGLTWQRSPPEYTSQRFDKWFAGRREAEKQRATRGKVVLWDDTFVRYHEPNIGIAAVKVLEAMGFEVSLVKGRKCCGRPAFSQGNLKAVRKVGEHNLALLNGEAEATPILFMEPSCFSMFAEDYRELNLPGWEAVARRCFVFEQFVEGILSQEPNAVKFKPKAGKVVIHAHCHLKALMNPKFLKRLAERLPQREATLLESGCCGMAGAFGGLADKYELSLKVAEPLMQQVRGQPYGTTVVASGTSCRHQISHLAPVRPRHMAEVLAEALL